MLTHTHEDDCVPLSPLLSHTDGTQGGELVQSTLKLRQLEHADKSVQLNEREAEECYKQL